MRPSQRLTVIDRIGRELQARYTFDEIDVYLGAFGIKPGGDAGSYNSKWVYSKNQLSEASSDVLSRIVEDLELEGLSALAHQGDPPDIWVGSNKFRLFVSHVSAEKTKATRLRDCLAPYAISAFVAHEDIHPTREWQGQIERGLFCMDALVALHTIGFSKSYWTQQEIGIAVGRGVPVFSIRMGEDPTGFISKRQAMSRGKKKAEEVAAELDALLSANEVTSERLAKAKELNNVMVENDDDIPF